MNRRRPAMIGWAAALTMLAAAVTGCSDESSTGGETSSSPTSGSSSVPEADAPSGPPRIDELDDGPLEPGSYALPPLGPVHDRLVVVDVPDGYGVWGSFIWAAKPHEIDDPLEIGGLWAVTGVYKDACKATAMYPAGPSVRSLANAFGRQKVTSTTKPRPVTFAGYHGLYLEITAPADREYWDCNDAELNFWDAAPDGGYWTRMPGMVDRLWILDVDGQPMMLAMFVPPSATDKQIRSLTNILRAAEFVDA
jgi:hypothetical protein